MQPSRTARRDEFLCQGRGRLKQPDAPDLTGLQPRCTWTTGRGLRTVLFASTSLQAVTAVIRLSSSPDSFDVVLSVVQLLASTVFLGA